MPWSHRPPWSKALQHRRPYWWPENETWPPHRHWGAQRGPFFRRLGCLFVLFSVFGLAFLFVAAGLILNAVGLMHLDSSQLGLVLPLAAVALVVMMTTFILAGRSLRRVWVPLDEMLAASHRVAEGDYSARVEEKGPPEIRSLARGFNSMAARLEVSDRQRRDMLADVTHELRTPLTVIQGNVEGMLDGLYAADEKNLRSLLEETQLLSRLVDDLRTLSLAESGALKLERESTNLSVLIRETVTGFRSAAEAAGVRLEVVTAEAPPVEIDPFRIREVLSNLIANALRYTPEGGTVRIKFEGNTISVRDEGPGIGAADLPHVFERYYRSRDSDGMGLGLSIAKYLVEAHGGEIRAESLTGQGTAIFFTLPQ